MLMRGEDGRGYRGRGGVEVGMEVIGWRRSGRVERAWVEILL